MRSLLSQLQGILLGAAIGEALGTLALQTQSADLTKADLTTIWDSTANLPALPLMRQLDQQVTQLLQRLEIGLLEHPLPGAIALTLFWQDQPERLRQVICTEIEPPVVQVELLAIAGALMQSLQHQLQPTRFLPQLLRELAQSPNLPLDSLIQVQSLVEAKASLATATTQLTELSSASAQAVALALFCWLTTPNQFALTVCRTAQARLSPQAGFVAGALAGSQASITVMQQQWRLPLPLTEYYQAQARQILAVWSGAEPHVLLPELAVGIAGTLRDRPG